MDKELDVLIEFFKPTVTKTVAGFDFLVANYKGQKIILSKTNMGVINACVATYACINEFEPDLVINQGCAGGHTAEVKNGDLIVGEKTV